MVVVFPDTKIADLKSHFSTTTYCWEHLPPVYGDDTPHAAYYLFVKAAKPVQAVSWFSRMTANWTSRRLRPQSFLQICCCSRSVRTAWDGIYGPPLGDRQVSPCMCCPEVMVHATLNPLASHSFPMLW